MRGGLGIAGLRFRESRQRELLEEFGQINGDRTSRTLKEKIKDILSGAEK